MNRSLLRSMLLLVGCAAAALAQGPGGPRGMRYHTATESKPLQLVSATETLRERNEVRISLRPSTRDIRSNGIPDHKVGAFPNRGNPNPISEQDYRFQLPAEGELQSSTTAQRGPTGFAINGVPFDPGAAEYWHGDPNSGWRYEALGGAVALGLDENYGHVQPTGAYHYHGLPTLLLEKIGVKEGEHSPIVGWAADGFPIYALYGYSDPKDPASAITAMKSSYQLKSGSRPGGDLPDGKHDGAFVQDYEYVEKLGTLDACNGRFTVTPEYPDGTYAYFLTETWPVIPRELHGEPVFMRGPGGSGGPGGGPGSRPPQGPGGPPRGPGGGPPQGPPRR